MATSPEHFLPSGIGGRLRPILLCTDHQRRTNERCDAPFLAQLQYLVHALRVVKDRDRGNPGSTVRGEDEHGNPYVVDADHKPRLDMTVTARSFDGKPIQGRFQTRQQAENFLQTLGLSLDDPTVTVEERTEEPPELQFGLVIGGDAGLRGVLKIAYEFVRGQDDGLVLDAGADMDIRKALLGDYDPSPYVRWLPFAMLPSADQAPYYSHRLAAWQDGQQVIAIVELFNLLPFAVRLPGLGLGAPALYNQGIQGEPPDVGVPSTLPVWHWDDIPEHAQDENFFEEYQERLNGIFKAMQLGDFVRIVSRGVLSAMRRAATTTSTDSIIEDAVAEASRLLSRPDVEELVAEIRALATNLVHALRS